jgi:phage/plasmid-like protein (TIGR03299 family)
MSAEIYTLNNGKKSMAFVGQTPWRGLGQKLTENAPLEIWRSEAGLNWSILESDINYQTRDGQNLTIPDQRALYRSDTSESLSIVSDRYQIVQPADVLEFFRDLTEQYGFILDTAGSLKGGRKFWALARTGMDLTLKGGDKIGNYLLLATSCDGSMATTGTFTSVRVVCQNTLSAALSHANNAVKVRHNTKFNADQVKDSLGIVRTAWDEFGDIIELMSDVPVTPKQSAEVIYNLFKTPGAESINDESTRTKNIIRDVWRSVKTSPGANLPSADGKAWGLLNGITHYIDHEQNSRSTDNRLNNAWFGKGNQIKNEAFEVITEIVKSA